MGRRRAIGFIVTLTSAMGFVHAARAQAVTQIATIAALRIDVTPGNVNVGSYATLGDGGGGEFVSASTTGTSCVDDGGIVIQASVTVMGTITTLCWYRQFTGAVHLKWYGIASQTDGTSASSTVTALNNALAVTAAANPDVTAAANRTVDTDGMRIYVNQSIEIPADVRLTCDATPGAQRLVSVSGTSYPDYSATPASIVFINPDTIHGYSLASPLITMTGGPPLHHDNSELDHCILLTVGNATDPDSKIILNPGSAADNPKPVQNAMQDVRNMVRNGGTGVECDNAGGCNVHDNLIIGFDTAIEGHKSGHLKLDANAMDADVGIFLTDTNSPVDITGFEMDSFLTHGMNFDYPLNSNVVSNGAGGVCQINMDDSSDFAVGDPVDVVGVTPLSCNGLAFVKQTDSGNHWIQLENTAYTPPTTTMASWYGSSSVISVSSTLGIWPGMGISCSGCTGFPTGASIVSVSRYAPLVPASGNVYKIVISAPVTASGSGTLTLSTSSGSMGGTVHLYSALRPRAGKSEGGQGTYGADGTLGTGTCLQVGSDADSGNPDVNSLGVKVVNGQCFGHEIAYAFAAAGPGGCLNCSGNNQPGIQDLSEIALLVKGANTGYLGFSSIAIAGNGGAIVDLASNDNTPTNHCVGFSDLQIDPGTSGSIGFLGANGCFTATGVRSGIGGPPNWVLEKGASGSPVSGTITASNSPNTTVYEEDSGVAAQVSCASNIFATSTCGNSLFSVASAGSTPGCVVLGGSCTVAGTNNAMAVTTPSTVATTTASITFVPAFSSAPTCVANNKDTATTASVTVSNSLPGSITLKFSASVTNVTVNVLCIGH